jgi:hypothetical protein
MVGKSHADLVRFIPNSHRDGRHCKILGEAITEHGTYSARVRIAVALSASHWRRHKGGMMTAGAKPDHAETSLLNLPPNLRQRQIALGIVLILPAGFAVTALLATTPLPQVARGAFLMRLSPPSPKARDWALHFAG